MTYRIVRDDGLILARGVPSLRIATQILAELSSTTTVDAHYRVVRDDRKTIGIANDGSVVNHPRVPNGSKRPPHGKGNA